MHSKKARSSNPAAVGQSNLAPITAALPIEAPSLRGARILFLVDQIAAITDGGTERQILQMIEICKQSGMKPQLCVLRRTRWLTSEIAGCPVTHFQIEKLVSIRALRIVAQITRWMHQQKFDILQTFFSEANLIGPCMGRVAGIPVILGTRRNLNHPRRRDPNRRMLRVQRVVNLLANQTLVNSHAVMERIVESEGISRKRICVVYNGIDLSHMRPAPQLREPMRRSLGISDDQILVGNVSGLRKIKGVQMFVDAAAEAYRTDPRLRFLLVGDGDLRPQLEQSIRNYGLEGIVRLNGPADDVRPYLAAFDVAVLCSHAEGFSNSLLEYMACGVPVIATDVGGNREALGACGLLVRPQATDLAGAIQVMMSPQARSNFAAAGLHKVKDFDLPNAHERMAGIYSHYMTRRGLRRGRIAQFVAHILGQPLKAEEV
ncbi:MAG TPA: glycosyltransferase [Silvibacterium sp.]|nr:glycosyltransferase [Silvibacterium sp.]